MAYPPHDRGTDSYRPYYSRDDGPPLPPPDMFQFRGAAGGRDRNDDYRPDFTFRAKTKISDRPLLRTRRGSKEEQVINTAQSHGDKFRNLDELTDSDEAEMEGSDEDEDSRPSLKRAKVEETCEKPKWSNPDVYTSLPAPSDTTGKKVDFVKLIRKARNANSKSTDLAANDDDFISFDDLNDLDTPPFNAPLGPRAQNTDVTLGKRKRGDTEGAQRMSRRGGYLSEDGMVLHEWRERGAIPPTPWLQFHKDDAPGLALHKEILDFYEWVKPREYESEVRAGVIDRVSEFLNRIEPGELKAFGSYAAGLYLPTGDMDLVYLTRSFNPRNNFGNNLTNNRFRKLADYIRRCGIARPNTVIAIPKAKVPIIKFVESISGLKVDLSFNNDTGIVAIGTFRKWREQYPAMPILVSVVKQFLMIRGLNDVAVGGLGGFSIICLVTSILQHMPLSATPPNLGQLLVEFFNVYGNLFDRDTVAIRLDPPGYIDKLGYMPFLTTKEKSSRLTIVDPNRADNNISGGTHEIQTIFSCFSRAHNVLQNRLTDFKDHEHSSGNSFSFLADLVGGNFRAYQDQRDVLYRLHYGHAGPAPAIIPPPPPPVTREPLPPPPPPPPSNPTKNPPKKQKTGSAARGKSSTTTSDGETGTRKPGSKKPTKAERRAMRLKTLRPELAPLIGSSVSLDDAVKYGKYKDYNEMDKDLTKRELELSVEQELAV